MDQLKRLFKQFVAEEDGATMIEYGLLAALIALVVAAAVITVQTALTGQFNAIADTIDATTTP